MIHAAPSGALEVRFASDGGAQLQGRFPFGVQTELAPGRFEVFAPGALRPRDEVHLLVAHQYGQPLASTRNGTLRLVDTADALEVEARIDAAVARLGYAAEALALVKAGLVRGLSPGFVVARGGEMVQRRPDGLLRTIQQADLAELSIVTRAAYPQATVEPRAWQPTGPAASPRLRWRA